MRNEEVDCKRVEVHLEVGTRSTVGTGRHVALGIGAQSEPVPVHGMGKEGELGVQPLGRLVFGPRLVEPCGKVWKVNVDDGLRQPPGRVRGRSFRREHDEIPGIGERRLPVVPMLEVLPPASLNLGKSPLPAAANTKVGAFSERSLDIGET